MVPRGAFLSLLLLQAAGSCAAGEPGLRTASTHPLRYYLVEPSRSPPQGQRVPVLVCLAGADADFLGAARRFAEARGETPILLVVPCTFSNTNVLRGPLRQRYVDLYGEGVVGPVGGGLPPNVRTRLAWDEAGLLALLGDLARDPTLERKVYLTGFSGGGILAWWMTLRCPESLAGVIPVCPNHAFWQVSRADANPGERSAPVLVVSGEQDTLRHSRIGLPMPPLAITVILVAVSALAAGRLAWGRWRRVRAVLAVELGVVILGCVLLAARMSGNDYQAAVAVEMMEGLGHQVKWESQPRMWHDPAPARVLRAVAEWRLGRSE